MQITFYSPFGEPWNWRNPPGGSEAAVVQLSRRLSYRGHECRVYAPMSQKYDHDGAVEWRDRAELNVSRTGLWYFHRCPESIDQFIDNPTQTRWLWCDDSDYGPLLTPERATRFDAVFGLSGPHAEHLRNCYPLANVIATAGGIESDRIRDVPDQERDPHAIIWANSWDRGLDYMLRIFSRSREFEPRLSLHVYYGCDGLKHGAKTNPIPRLFLERIAKMPKDGVIFYDRLPQVELWKAYKRCSYWVYPTRFHETCCVVAKESQALGCVPIYHPIGALSETVRHGFAIVGDPRDAITRARYSMTLIQLMANPSVAEQCRAEMMPDALEAFDWEKTIDQHEAMMKESALCSA